MIALAPGVVETSMQEIIRSTDPEDFPEIGKFIGLKESGSLASPTDAARRVLEFLDSGAIKGGGVYDVREVG